jgi:propanol-preferring alcohol dehydrogenase
MVLDAPARPLRLEERADPRPGPGEVRIAVSACGLCRSDLHIANGELSDARLPLILGHQIVGAVEAAGPDVTHPAAGDRVGVPWLASTDQVCEYCRSGRENLCPNALFTGYTVDGGYADVAVAKAAYCLPLPEGYADLAVAPLLCAGMIGFRALRFTGSAQRLGLYGFGAAAHIVIQVARHQGRRVFAFTRGGDEPAQRFALELGAEWAGDALQPGPEPLDAAIIFAPAGELVPAALRAVAPGGSVVCGGIHMSDIPAFPYSLLWGERSLRSVANLTREDGREFLQLAPRIPIHTNVEVFALDQANAALARLREGSIRGAAVLTMQPASSTPPGTPRS